MKKGVFLVMAVLAIVVACAAAAQARDGHGRGGGHGGGHSEFVFRGGFWFGPGWWGSPYYPYPPYPAYPYYPYYPYPGPPVVREEPRVYVSPPEQQQQEEDYWYFCTNPQGYYPYVKDCPGGWMQVVPSTPSGPKR